jgi:hypothetical protein
MRCSSCKNSLVIGDHRIPLDDWLAKKFLGHVIDRHLNFDLVVDQISVDQLEEMEGLFYESVDKCFECFFEICCKNFSWDFGLLDLHVPLAKHHYLCGLTQVAEQLNEGWLDFFIDGINFGHATALYELIRDEFAQNGEQYLAFQKQCDEVSLSSDSTAAILEWLGDRSDDFENIKFQFWEIVRNGYRTSKDLELLDVEGNFDFDGEWELAPNIDFLRNHQVSAQNFIDLDDTLNTCFEDVYCGTFEDKVSLLQKMIENRISSVDIQRLLSDEYAPLRFDYPFFDDSDEIYLQSEHLFLVFENLLQLRLPINSGTFLKYFGLSKDHILFSIDNSIDDSDYFLCARLFRDAPISWLEKSTELLKVGVPILDIQEILSKPDGYDFLSKRVLDVPIIRRVVLLLRNNAELLTWDAYGWTEMFGDTQDAELIEWTSVKVQPVMAREWKISGFTPVEAKAWSREVEDPHIALRRLQAGILPPTISD